MEQMHENPFQSPETLPEPETTSGLRRFFCFTFYSLAYACFFLSVVFILLTTGLLLDGHDDAYQPAIVAAISGTIAFASRAYARWIAIAP
jgi:hypothetical protein